MRGGKGWGDSKIRFEAEYRDNPKDFLVEVNDRLLWREQIPIAAKFSGFDTDYSFLDRFIIQQTYYCRFVGFNLINLN